MQEMDSWCYNTYQPPHREIELESIILASYCQVLLIQLG